MKTLPPQSNPPAEPSTRRHSPEPAEKWANHRSCLRWDFGFTCAFCLLHESDFFLGRPGEGLGVMTVEHRRTRKEAPDLAAVYDNCYYACRLCNQARGTKPIEVDGVALLDASKDAWADHFEYSGDHLKPKEGDRAAEYTHRAYDLDSPSKTIRRALRRELILDRLRLLSEIGREIAELLELAGRLRMSQPDSFDQLWRSIKDLREQAQRAASDLSVYRAVPVDAPESCRCKADDAMTLPAWLEQQCIDVVDLPL